MPFGKNPGLNGYSSTFYKQCRDILSLILNTTFNVISESCYRHISLINVDLKVYAKILANRLQSLIPSIINIDQIGSVLTCKVDINTIRTLSLISYLQRNKFPMCFLSHDAEKSIDPLDWRSLIASLRQIGLSQSFIHKIMALYTLPTVRTKVNGMLSDQVPISNSGLGDGYFSCSSCIIAMELLAMALRANDSI